MIIIEKEVQSCKRGSELQKGQDSEDFWRLVFVTSTKEKSHKLRHTVVVEYWMRFLPKGQKLTSNACYSK